MTFISLIVLFMYQNNKIKKRNIITKKYLSKQKTAEELKKVLKDRYSSFSSFLKNKIKYISNILKKYSIKTRRRIRLLLFKNNTEKKESSFLREIKKK